MKEPPAGVEPAPRPYKGRVLAVDTTEARVETVGVEPTSSSLQARRSSKLSYIPWMLEDEVRTGGVEPPQHEATGLQPAELADAQRPHELRVAGRARTGASGDHNPGCFRLHHGHHESGDDRTRTGGLSPDKRVLCTSELRPQIEKERSGRRDRLPATGDRDVAV
jgi:hypothetical protein